MKTAIRLLLLATVVAVFFSGCTAQAEIEAAPDRIITVSRGDLQQVITPSGSISMPRSINLTFGSSGTVYDIPVQIGQKVTQGQVLATLDTLPLEAALLQAEINAKTAQYSLQQALNPNTKSTSRYGIARDPATIDIKQMQVNLAILTLEEARTNLDNAVMKAPFDGMIGSISIKKGDSVNANTIAIRLVDPQQIKVTARVNEGDIFKISIGAGATVQIDAIPRMQLPGLISAIGASASAAEGIASYLVEIQVSSQDVVRAISSVTDQANKISDLYLREGLTTTVTIITAEKKNVLLIPLSALTRNGSSTHVSVYRIDGSVEKRSVSTGMSTWQYIEITNGLQDGESIIIP